MGISEKVLEAEGGNTLKRKGNHPYRQGKSYGSRYSPYKRKADSAGNPG
jgi:hypothetical protein